MTNAFLHCETVVHYHSMLRATFFPQLSVSLIANVYAAAMSADGCECGNGRLGR